MIVYISGPMSGVDGYNFPMFNAVARLLRRAGHFVFNPAENFKGRTDMPRRDYIRADVQQVLSAGAITLLPGWQTSKGAQLEKNLAEELGLLVFFACDPSKLPLSGDATQVRMLRRLPCPKCHVHPETTPPTFPDAPETICQEADRIVDGARQDAYGHPFDDFSRTAIGWKMMTGHTFTAEEVALCLIQVKLSREVNAHKRDNLVDVCGYVKTLDMVTNEREKRAIKNTRPEAESLLVRPNLAGTLTPPSARFGRLP